MTTNTEEAAREALRRAAEQANAVTSGNRWLAEGGGIVLDPDREGNSWDSTIVCQTAEGEGPHRKWILRDYIAAANPTVVLGLLDMIDSLVREMHQRELLSQASLRALVESPKVIERPGQVMPIYGEDPGIVVDTDSFSPMTDLDGNVLESPTDPYDNGCEHDWRMRVAGGSLCSKCSLWIDKRFPVESPTGARADIWREDARAALAALEGLRGFTDLAYYRPSQHMTVEEHAEAYALIHEVRAALEAARAVPRVVPEPPTETQWEYGLTWHPSMTGDGAWPQSYAGCETEEGAWETGRRLAGVSQKPMVWKRPVRPAIQAVPAGPWEPVTEQPNRSEQ